MNSDDLITIIVPIYNVEIYMERCIDSIIEQTYKKIEIILVDDGSTDKSGDICDEYAKKDTRIKVIHTKNNGVSSARNKGMEIANGEWISFVDADDWIEKDFCEKMINETLKNQNIDMVCSGYNRVYPKRQETINCKTPRIIYSAQEYLIKLLNVQNGYGFCHMKLIRKSCIKNIRFHENIKVGEDALFNMELVKNIHEIIILGQALYNYRFNNASVVRKYDPDYANKYQSAMIETKNYISSHYKNNSEVEGNYYNYVAYHVLLIIVNYCFNKENSKNLKEQIKLLKQVCNIDEFRQAIQKSSYNDLSITRSITLFTIKHKLYFVAALICIYRQHQFKK